MRRRPMGLAHGLMLMQEEHTRFGWVQRAVRMLLASRTVAWLNPQMFRGNDLKTIITRIYVHSPTLYLYLQLVCWSI